VSGVGAEASLQRICAGDVGGPIGKITYTQWLNARGGIEADLTVTRLAANDYLVVTAGATGRRDLGWLRDHLAEAEATEITDDLAVLSVMGPNARALIGAVCDADLSNEAFPFATSQEIVIAGVRVRASRITYVGELGWELYIPSAGAVTVFDALMAAGPAHGLKLAGMHAMDSCRMEKGYRHWGHDIADEDTPIEAGLMFAVKLAKEVDFIGRDALLALKGKPLTKRLLHFKLKDPEPLLYHNEPIWRGSELVGRVTSGAYGHSLGAAVALGLVENAEGVDANYVAGDFEIEVAGVKVPATASLAPFYDPKSLRVKL
jgi:glycine cleavage system aminomethyltransferase T